MCARSLALTCGWLALAALAPPVFSQDEPQAAEDPQGFVAPPNTVPLEESGTLDQCASDVVRIHDSNMKPWLLKILPSTKISVTGNAKVDYLRPGVGIEFANELNKKGHLAEPIAEIDLLPEKSTLGLLAADDAESTRPVRNPEPGAYRIRAKVSAVKGGQLTVAIGGKRFTGELAEGDELKINFTSDDPNLAATGDAVKVKAWYYENAPGRAIAEDIAITLAKPPEPASRRKR
jgi:hypothetical protein